MQEHLFEQLHQLLSRALLEPQGKEQLATVRLLACKVEEIHTTLRKHLRKEEEQLLPLLVAHFTAGEQAELVAQFLCSIPLSTVEVRAAHIATIRQYCWVLPTGNIAGCFSGAVSLRGGALAGR